MIQMRKIVVFLSIIGCLVSNVSYISVNAQEETVMTEICKERWEKNRTYPVTPEDEAWKSLSYLEQLEACSMPKEMLSECTTEELVVLVLGYPFLIDVVTFDSAQEGIEYLQNTSNICRELFSRSEARAVLLEAYETLSVDYERIMTMATEDNDNPLVDSGYVKEMFLQTYFASEHEKMCSVEVGKLKEILSEKEIQRTEVCNYTTRLIFYDWMQNEYGEIPSQYVIEEVNISNESKSYIVEDGSIYALNSGFTPKYNSLDEPILQTMYQAGTYVVGTYTLYGETVPCLQFYDGELTSTEKYNYNVTISTAHSSWTYKYEASRKYNCHSYTWINSSRLNVYWLENPDEFANSSSFSHFGKNGSANVGHKIIIRKYSNGADVSDGTYPVHSLNVLVSGSNSVSIMTESKLDAYGVYEAPLVDMLIRYSGNFYDVYEEN